MLSWLKVQDPPVANNESFAFFLRNLSQEVEELSCSYSLVSRLLPPSSVIFNLVLDLTCDS